MFRPADRFRHVGTDVWSIFTPLANAHGAVNLGQGFPNFPAPSFVKQAAAAAVMVDSLNQYSPTAGLPRLRHALSASYSPLFARTLNPDTEILVTQGATEGTVAALLGFLNPGDEVILIEPFYDMYTSNVGMAGAVPVFVPLRIRPGVDQSLKFSSNDWFLDIAELKGRLLPSPPPSPSPPIAVLCCPV